jgi:hypothetical protein
MAQPPQPEAADGGANMALLCAAQKLLYADAFAPAHPKNAAEAPMMENLKPLQLPGRDGQDSAPYNRAESAKLPFMTLILSAQYIIVVGLLHLLFPAFLIASPLGECQQIQQIQNLVLRVLYPDWARSARAVTRERRECAKLIMDATRFLVRSKAHSYI